MHRVGKETGIGIAERSRLPHVLEYIQEIREERERRYGVYYWSLERLHKLSLGAEEAGQFSAAITLKKLDRLWVV